MIVPRSSVGGTATYFCNTGYTLSGSSSRTCQSNGVWSGLVPTCQIGEHLHIKNNLTSNFLKSFAVQCLNLTNPANGRVTVTTISFNGVATYSCNTGYTLSGSVTRACLSSGAWSGSVPTCNASKLPHNELTWSKNTSILFNSSPSN